jgi:hypothetical protein
MPKKSKTEKDEIMENGEWVEDGELRLDPDEIFAGATFLSTGLGWKGERLRYFFVVNKPKRKTLVTKEKTSIKKILHEVGERYDGIVGMVDFGKEYALVEISLSPMIAVAEYIDACIDICQKKNAMLSDSFLVTNVVKPSKEVIETYLKDEMPAGFREDR